MDLSFFLLVLFCKKKSLFFYELFITLLIKTIEINPSAWLGSSPNECRKHSPKQKQTNPKTLISPAVLLCAGTELGKDRAHGAALDWQKYIWAFSLTH